MSKNSLQPHDAQLWRMRWFVICILAIGFLGSIAASIIIKSPIPSFLNLFMYPAICWLFPPKQPSKFSLVLQILLDTWRNKKQIP